MVEVSLDSVSLWRLSITQMRKKQEEQIRLERSARDQNCRSLVSASRGLGSDTLQLQTQYNMPSSLPSPSSSFTPLPTGRFILDKSLAMHVLRMEQHVAGSCRSLHGSRPPSFVLGCGFIHPLLPSRMLGFAHNMRSPLDIPAINKSRNLKASICSTTVTYRLRLWSWMSAMNLRPGSTKIWSPNAVYD